MAFRIRSSSDINRAVGILLDQKGMTRSDLARAWNVSPSRITQLLGEGSNPKLETLVHMADYFGYDVVLRQRK
jgi:transcriptional regulator with XRE-family HTH domain